MREMMRMQVAFYASTPSYRSVMRLHGWEAHAEQLSTLAARGGWGEMPAVVADAMLAEFLVEGTWAELGGKLREKYDGLVDRLALYLPFTPSEIDENWKTVAKAIK
jgi:hypothetical protein